VENRRPTLLVQMKQAGVMAAVADLTNSSGSIMSGLSERRGALALEIPHGK
jgi:hypothetical protein